METGTRRILLAQRDGYSILWSETDDGGGLDALDEFASHLGIANTRCSISLPDYVGEHYHYRLRPGAETERALAQGAVESDLAAWIKQERERERQGE